MDRLEYLQGSGFLEARPSEAGTVWVGGGDAGGMGRWQVAGGMVGVFW